MAGELEIAGAHKRMVKGNNDWYYGGGEEAWASKSAALAGVPAAIRIGKTVGVYQDGIISEYIWRAGTADSDLIKKGDGVTPVYSSADTYRAGDEVKEQVNGLWLVYVRTEEVPLPPELPPAPSNDPQHLYWKPIGVHPKNATLSNDTAQFAI